MWTWLRLAETMSILRERMDKILELYTSQSAKTYLNFLFSIAPTWAVCCFNWSLKARLGNQKVDLHRIVPFFRDVMQKRNLTRVRLSHADTISQLHIRAVDAGCQKFSERIKVYLTKEGQQETLRRLQQSFDFKVVKKEVKNSA